MTLITHLDTIYTATEAAERMMLTNRGIIRIVRKYGYCSRFGREYLFSEADLLAIWHALREPAKEARAVTMKVPPSEYQTHRSLMALTAKRRRSPSKSADGPC